MHGNFQTVAASPIMNNHPDMLYRLGMMCLEGRDCERDLVNAHKWLNIAAIRGSDAAAVVKAELTATMKKADIVLALRAAREWLVQH